MATKLNPKDLSAVGAGVDQSITGQLTKFIVRGVKGQVEKLGVTIDGPAQPSAMKTPLDDGNIEVSYTPSLPGEYSVEVTIEGKPIKGSPYKSEVIGEKDPKLERVSRVHVAGKGIMIGKSCYPNEFWIDGRDAAIAAGLTVHMKNPPRASSGLKINDMGDGTFKCVYKPTNSGLYIIDIKVEGIHVPGSPFYVRIM
ncbi:filamin-B-like [Brevipalpus obovatus]|uniref:filamin-B-like n=1 Tax=Brevipalpus obovatus TaxID=246614 RepID=UPI003D9DC139